MDTPHDITDQSLEETSVDDHKKRSGPRGGVNVPFPTKLHVMLSKVEADGLTDIVSWYVLHNELAMFFPAKFFPDSFIWTAYQATTWAMFCYSQT